MKNINAGSVQVEAAFDKEGELVAACLSFHPEFGEFAKKHIEQGCEIRTITVDELIRIADQRR